MKKSKKSFLLILEDERPSSVNAYYSGRHWGWRMRETKRVFGVVQAACAQWKAKMRRPLPRFSNVRIVAKGYFSHHPLDASNICIKPYEDALRRLGIIPDDDYTHVRSVTLESRVDKEHPRLEIHVYSEDEEEPKEVRDEKGRKG